MLSQLKREKIVLTSQTGTISKRLNKHLSTKPIDSKESKLIKMIPHTALLLPAKAEQKVWYIVSYDILKLTRKVVVFEYIVVLLHYYEIT